MQECPNRQMALSFNQQTHYCFLYYYSRCPQFILLSARIFDFSLPEREFEIREISHNSAFAIPLFINLVIPSKKMEMTETHVKDLTFLLQSITTESLNSLSLKRDFKCASVPKAGWQIGGYSEKTPKQQNTSSTLKTMSLKRQNLYIKIARFVFYT